MNLPQSYYDMAVYQQSGRFPAQLPDSLKPKPGLPAQQRVYSDFARVRLTAMPGMADRQQQHAAAAAVAGVAEPMNLRTSPLQAMDPAAAAAAAEQVPEMRLPEGAVAAGAQGLTGVGTAAAGAGAGAGQGTGGCSIVPSR